jgi:SAM-dependent methyltransferase
MGFYNERIVPRMVDRMCGAPAMQPMRDKAAEGLSGVIIELGFGSGRNASSYPSEVTLVHAIEPSGLARELGAERIAAATVEIRFAGLHGESLPLDDNSCDGAFCTFTLCTIPGVDRALDELRRVLKPGGRFNFLEHGLAPDESVRKWQRRIDPIEKKLADGCHLTRDPVALVRNAGFVIDSVESGYTKGPKPWTYFTTGSATNPA